jgi:hypothetical protein
MFYKNKQKLPYLLQKEVSTDTSYFTNYLIHDRPNLREFWNLFSQCVSDIYSVQAQQLIQNKWVFM